MAGSFDDFLCEVFTLHVEGYTRVEVNSGYMIPITPVTVFVGAGERIEQAHPWMDTYHYPWTLYTERPTDVQLMRILPYGR